MPVEGDGIGETDELNDQAAVPDPSLAAGPSQLIASVNAVLASFTKGDSSTTPPTPPTLQWSQAWSDFFINSVPPLALHRFYDGTVTYDDVSNHFLFTLIADDALTNYNSEFLVVGQSMSSAPTSQSTPSGAWCVYPIPVAAGTLPDFPKIGFSNNHVYVTDNDFGPPSPPLQPNWAYQGASLYVLPKIDPIVGCVTVSIPHMTRLTNNDGSLAFTVQPATHGGNEPFYMVNAHAESGNIDPANRLSAQSLGRKLTLWQVNSDNSIQHSPITLCETNCYFQPAAAPQGADGPTLDDIDARLLNAVSYRPGGDPLQEVLVTAQAASSGAAGPSEVRIYQISVGTGAVTTTTYSAANAWYFNVSVSLNSAGNAVATFTRTSNNEYPQVEVAEKTSSGWQPAVVLKSSVTSYTDDVSRGATPPYRWGDFAGTSPDPSRPSIWAYNEYAAASDRWGTWMARLDF